jgi:3-isopropylmalate/(R)-2-methylmalate dehydratase small subunit
MSGQHPFDLPQFQGAEVLIVNANFGCGSSREHAPQALAKWGIRAIVGESFAEIFFGNCLAMGIPCVTVSHETSKTLQEEVNANPRAIVTVDLDAMQVVCDGFTAPLRIPDGPRTMLTSGTWDACGQLVAQAQQIRATAATLPYVRW